MAIYEQPAQLLQHLIRVNTTNPPGNEAEGFIWGRGALDMKGGVAMMLSAFLRAKAESRADACRVASCNRRRGGVRGYYIRD
jgi:arginine utilization protein RocB